VFGERLRDTRLRREAFGPVQVDLEVSQHIVTSGRHDRPAGAPRRSWVPPLEGPAEIYAALVTGTGDYVRKTGAFEKVLVGLSGGIDSSLTAAVAVDALGSDNVVGVLMPSRFTSDASLEDACELARLLGIRTFELSVEDGRQALEGTLAPVFEGTQPSLAEENLQARIRGNLLMTISNKFGWMVLTTGNKSEMATGYATLYGDMAGGFAVLKDIPKTLVFELCRYRNGQGETPVIPDRVLTKAPTAELRENQKDEDSLPPYPELDPILQGYVEDDRSVEELVAAGHDPETVRRAVHLVDISEYKRRQAPPGVKITPRAFGRDRRMPITNRYQPDGLRAVTSPPAPRRVAKRR
jgi:NAD+ synthase (glutamine-hydrolysing)